MSNSKLPDLINAIVVEEETPVYFDEICHTLHVEKDFVISLIEYDIVQPLGHNEKEWRFDSTNLKRARTAVSFYRDLGVNLNGIALAFELLEQLNKF